MAVFPRNCQQGYYRFEYYYEILNLILLQYSKFPQIKPAPAESVAYLNVRRSGLAPYLEHHGAMHGLPSIGLEQN
jgi:hypothetical protein